LYQRIAPDAKLGKNVQIFGYVNLYGCEIDDGSKIGCFVEIQKIRTLKKNLKSQAVHFSVTLGGMQFAR
jgi:UDP-2-acetamido-3-amino-2,3-dideoxy-glucuronate N-acetyltransferase